MWYCDFSQLTCSRNCVNLLCSCQCERCHLTSVDMQEAASVQSDISGLIDCFSWVSSILKNVFTLLQRGCYDLIVRQRRKGGLLFEISFFKTALNLCACFMLFFCLQILSSGSQLTFRHKLVSRPPRCRAETMALGFIFSKHLAHSQFQSGPSWKWHKLLFGLPHRSVPLLLFSSGDYWANLSRINGGGEGIPFCTERARNELGTVQA